MEVIGEWESGRLVHQCTATYGAVSTFCFVVLGSVRLAPSAFHGVRAGALEQHHASTNVQIELQATTLSPAPPSHPLHTRRGASTTWRAQILCAICFRR